MAKKILIITSTFPRWKNDITPAFVFDLAKNLTQQKMDVAVLAPHHQGAKFQENMDRVAIYRFPYFYPLSLQRLSYNGGVLPSLKRSNLAKLQVLFFLASEFLSTLLLVSRNRIQAINSHWIIPQGFIGALARKLTSVEKHIVTIHAGDISLLERLPFKKLVFAFIIKNSDSLVFVSRYGKVRLKKLVWPILMKEFARKTKIVPMGVYVKDFQRKVDCHHSKRLLFVGRLAEKKGVEYLLKSVPLVRKKISDIRLIIVGDGPLKSTLIDLTRKSGIEDCVDFVGFKTGKEKIDYFVSCSALIAPSIQTKEGDVEGLPVVIMEGMAAGKPIVASKVGGISEIVKDYENGLLVDQRSPDRLAEKIVYLLNRPEIAKRMGQKSLSLARNYDWKAIGIKYANIL